MNFIKIKNIYASENIIKKVKKTPQNRRKCLQILYLMICNVDPEYIKNPYNATIKRQINFKKNEGNNKEVPHISIRTAKIQNIDIIKC